MTRERASELLSEVMVLDDPEMAEAHRVAISALRQKERFGEANKTLTLDELRKMSGEPVFVVTDRLKEWCLVHSHNSDDVIGGGIIMTRRTAEKRTYQYACYGKTWLAYRQQPAEEDDHAICGATNLPCIKCNPGWCNNRKEGAD